MAINFLNTVAVDDSVLFVDTTNDRVGIGTASPVVKLDVEAGGTGDLLGDSTTAAIFRAGRQNVWLQNQRTAAGTDWNNNTFKLIAKIDSTSHQSINFVNDASYNEHIDIYTGNQVFNTRFTHDGKVGIGTTNPVTKLNVVGNISVSSTKAYRMYNAANNGWGEMTFVEADNRIQFNRGIQNSGADFRLTENSVDSFVCANEGDFGIGTDSPGEKLDVNGNIKIKNALLSNQENTDVDTGAEVVAQVAHATYTAAFFDFVVKKGTNVRSGTVYACHNGDSTPLVEFTETSTQDLGDTSDVTLSVDISGANMRLLATVASDDWSVKSLIRAI